MLILSVNIFLSTLGIAFVFGLFLRLGKGFAITVRLGVWELFMSLCGEDLDGHFMISNVSFSRHK